MPTVQTKVKLSTPKSPVKKTTTQQQQSKSNSSQNSPKSKLAKSRINTNINPTNKNIAKKQDESEKSNYTDNANFEEMYSILNTIDQRLLKLRQEMDAKFESLEQEYQDTYKIFENLKSKQEIFASKIE